MTQTCLECQDNGETFDVSVMDDVNIIPLLIANSIFFWSEMKNAFGSIVSEAQERELDVIPMITEYKNQKERMQRCSWIDKSRSDWFRLIVTRPR